MENNLNRLKINEMLELNKCEKKIKDQINKNKSNEIIFQKYGLLNKNWIEKYKYYYNYEHFLQKNEFISPSDKQDIFDITYLLPKFDESSLNDDVEDIKNLHCSIPINFTLVSKNFLDLIKQHF